MKSFKNILTGILFIAVVAHSQDFVLDVEGMGRNYQTPVDTSFRMIFLDDYEMSSTDPAPVFNLFIDFPDTLSHTVEYSFVCFIHGQFQNPEADDTLSFEVNGESLIDSISIEPIEFYGKTTLGFKYVNFPGDQYSHISIQMDSDSTFYTSHHLRFWMKADTISSWLNFMPLALGNVWKYNGPAPLYVYKRQEVIEVYDIADSFFYKIATAKQYSPGYGEGIHHDTLLVYSIPTDPYRYYTPDSGIYFGSFLPPAYNDPYEYMGLFPNRDGSLLWGSVWLGGSWLWKYGVGFFEEYGDGFGRVSTLIGYSIDGVSVGDIGVLVGIDDNRYAVAPECITLSTFPNPFNASISIKFKVSRNTFPVIRILNVSGQEVHNEVLGSVVSGEGVYNWSPQNYLPSGVYVIQIVSEGAIANQKVLLLK